MKHRYTKRRNMVSRKNKNIKINKSKSKTRNKNKNIQKNKKRSLRKKYQKGGMDTASADLDPPAYRDSYDEEIYSTLNK